MQHARSEPEAPADAAAQKRHFSLALRFTSPADAPTQDDLKPHAEAVGKAVAAAIHGEADLVGEVVYCVASAMPSPAELAAATAAVQAIFPAAKWSALKALEAEADVTDLEFDAIEAALKKLDDLKEERVRNPSVGETEEFKTRLSAALDEVGVLEKKLKRITGQAVMEEGVIDVILNRTPPAVPDEWPLAKTFEEVGLQTGDVILFAGTHKKSVWIRQVQWSRYSHAAIVVREPAGGLYILQSNGDHGVTYDPLAAYVGGYDGRVVARRLSVPDPATRGAMQAKMEAFVKYTKGEPYTGKFDFVLMYFETILRGKGIKEKKAWFCSQLVAQAYMEMHLLPPHPLASVYVPQRFAHDCDMELPLLHGAKLDTPIRLPNKF